MVRFTPALKHGTLSSNQVFEHEVLGFGVNDGLAVVVAESLKVAGGVKLFASGVTDSRTVCRPERRIPIEG